jgi:hypothetical protein
MTSSYPVRVVVALDIVEDALWMVEKDHEQSRLEVATA